MPTFKNIKDLEKFVNQQAKKAMNQGSAVKNTVIETGKKHVQEDVYDVYSPNPMNPDTYIRTGELKENWKTEPTPDGIIIYNDRKDGDKNVAEVVETGQGYDYDFAYNGKPRPFTENTRNELRDSKKLTEALKKDLNSIGIKTN